MKYLKLPILLVVFSIFTFSNINTKPLDNPAFLKNFHRDTLGKVKKITEYMPHARAATADPFAEFVRFFFFMISGWPNEATYRTDTNCPSAALDDCDGPPMSGMVGFVDEIGDQIGQVIALRQGITTCAEIPTSGADISFTDTEGTFTISFAVGDTTIPSSYNFRPSSTHDKKVTVALNGDPLMAYEFTCASEAGIVHFAFPDGVADRIIEMYMDGSDANDKMVDFFMRYDDDSERMGMQFRTYANNKFSSWVVRAGKEDGGSTFDGFRGAVYGDYVTRKASAYVQFIGNQASLAALAAAGGASDVDFQASDNGSGCTANSCTVSVCVDAGTSTIGGVCSGLDPSSSIFSSAPQSLIGGATGLSINYAADAAELASDISSP